MANGMTSRVQTEAIWSIDLSVRQREPVSVWLARHLFEVH